MTESKNSRPPVFMKRGEGTSFAEFKKACIQAFREAGLFEKSEEFSTNLPDDNQLRLHKISEQGLQETLDKANQAPSQPSESTTKRESVEN